MIQHIFYTEFIQSWKFTNQKASSNWNSLQFCMISSLLFSLIWRRKTYFMLQGEILGRDYISYIIWNYHFSHIWIMLFKNTQLNMSEESDYKNFNIMWCIPLKGMIITMELTLLYSIWKNVLPGIQSISHQISKNAAEEAVKILKLQKD